MLVQVTSCLFRKQKLSLNISKCMHISRTEETQQITSLHELHVAFQRQELHCLFFTKRVLVQDRHILINLWWGWKLVNYYMPFPCILWWYFKRMSSFHYQKIQVARTSLILGVYIYIHLVHQYDFTWMAPFVTEVSQNIKAISLTFIFWSWSGAPVTINSKTTHQLFVISCVELILDYPCADYV